MPASSLQTRLLLSAAAGCAALLGACTVGPDFVAPKAPAASGYVAGPLPGLAAAGDQRVAPGQAPAGPWWSAFQSAELDAAMRLALDGNRSLAAAQASLDQAREEVTAAGGALYPQVTGAAGAGRQKYGAAFLGSQVHSFAPFSYFSAGPSVSYVLDYLGAEKRSVERRQALAQYRAFELAAAQLSLTGSVAQQAFTIASASAQIRAVEAIIEEDGRNLQLVQSAFEAGSGTRVDVLAAQSQLAADQTLLPPLRQERAVARHALALLAGKAPADWTPPDFELERLKLAQGLPLGLPSELARRRPDILAAEAQLHATTAELGMATADLYPQIRLTASISQQALSPGRLFGEGSSAWALAAGISGPIFDGGTLRANRRAAVDATRAALANYEQAVLQSFGQVADALEALDHDAELLAAQRRALDTAGDSLRLAQDSFRAGNSGVLQVLDAERLSQQARLGYVRALARRYQDTAGLMVALGGSVPAAASGGAAAKPE
ncbi:MAG: efflux transporter outer membrane subunit [Nevskia sp.]|nr:efflux transporter outer membrane subunit [Nevskia sp.]